MVGIFCCLDMGTCAPRTLCHDLNLNVKTYVGNQCAVSALKAVRGSMPAGVVRKEDSMATDGEKNLQPESASADLYWNLLIIIQ